MREYTSIKSAIAGIFFNQLKTAEIEANIGRKGGNSENFGALNDSMISMQRNHQQQLKRFADQGPDAFFEALNHFGPMAAMDLGQYIGSRDRAGFEPLVHAYIRLGNPEYDGPKTKEIFASLLSLEISNPHMIVLRALKQRARTVLDASDPDPAGIEDTKDGAMLRLVLSDYCDFADKKFCARLFEFALDRLETATDPLDRAHAGLILQTACDLLPENGIDPFAIDSTKPAVPEMIENTLRNHPWDEPTAGKLAQTAARVENLPDRAMATYPDRTAAGIYHDAFLSKIRAIMESDPSFEQDRRSETFRNVLTPCVA